MTVMVLPTVKGRNDLQSHSFTETDFLFLESAHHAETRVGRIERHA
jgi:hypothetical protein